MYSFDRTGHQHHHLFRPALTRLLLRFQWHLFQNSARSMYTVRRLREQMDP